MLAVTLSIEMYAVTRYVTQCQYAMSAFMYLIYSCLSLISTLLDVCLKAHLIAFLLFPFVTFSYICLSALQSLVSPLVSCL